MSQNATGGFLQHDPPFTWCGSMAFSASPQHTRERLVLILAHRMPEEGRLVA
jgi:hypothetical protein